MVHNRNFVFELKPWNSRVPYVEKYLPESKPMKLDLTASVNLKMKHKIDKYEYNKFGEWEYQGEIVNPDYERLPELIEEYIDRYGTWEYETIQVKVGERLSSPRARPPHGEVKRLIENIYEKKRVKKSFTFEGHYPPLMKTEIYNYLKIIPPIPFKPSIMINICPKWEKRKKPSKKDITLFEQVIEEYLHCCDRYSKWKYILESGSQGNNLHAHIVAEINPKQYKSVMTHIKKGKHNGKIRSIWDKVCGGYQGYLGAKQAIQSTIIRKDYILKDKLNYLIEDLKPDGHKNKEQIARPISNGFD